MFSKNAFLANLSNEIGAWSSIMKPAKRPCKAKTKTNIYIYINTKYLVIQGTSIPWHDTRRMTHLYTFTYIYIHLYTFIYTYIHLYEFYMISYALHISHYKCQIAHFKSHTTVIIYILCTCYVTFITLDIARCNYTFDTFHPLHTYIKYILHYTILYYIMFRYATWHDITSP